MKTLFATLFMCFSLSAQAQTATIEPYPSIGRTVINKSTGEKMDLVCLETVAPDAICNHFQLRYTDVQGKTSMLGSEIIMNTVPEEEFQRMVAENNKGYHHKKRWKFSPFPIAKSTEDVPLVYLVNLFPIVAGAALWGSSETATLGAILVAASFATPAIDLLITVAPLIAISTQRGIVKINEKIRAKKLQQATHAIFDAADVTQEAYILKNKPFNLLKNTLAGESI